jgi:hypothetical protein
MLEIAYWIGPQPGFWNGIIDREYNLERYRDRRMWGRNDAGERDRWVVFHFHFDETRQIFFSQGGHTYTGFVSY